MKKITHTLLVTAIGLLFTGTLKAQFPMSGTYNVPGTYSTVGAAINALNTYGVLGPVIINVAAGYTETATAGGYTLMNVVGSSSVNTITFQRSGTGANPIIYAYTGGTNTPISAIQDGVWRFVGTDYVTVDGIDITDPNSTNPATMEFGYGFFKANAIDGCQYNTIKNCTITLSHVNNAAGSGPAVDGSRGIDVVNALGNTHTSAITVLSASGSNSYNKFYGNTIQKCNYGISIMGFSASSPFTLADWGNDIGGSSSSTGNTIVNYGGGGTTASSGVRTLAQYNFNVAFNTINSNNGSHVNHTGLLRGIYLNTATSANATINNNTVTVRGGGTTTQLIPIENVSGGTAANNTITITNNLIANCTYSTATSGVWYGIYNNGASANHLIITGNTFSNNSTNATSGSYYNIYNTGAVTGSVVMSSNTITGITFSATTTSLTNYNIINTGGAATASIITSNNNISNITYLATTAGTGAWAGIYSSVSASASVVQNNLFNNLTLKNSGTIYIIYHSNASYYQTVSSNSIITAFNRVNGGSGTTYMYYNLNGSPGRVSCNIYDNDFSNFNNGTCTGTIYMMYSYYGCDLTNIYNNRFDNISAPSGTGSMYCFYGPYYSLTNNIYNNSFTNITYGTGTIYGMYFYNYYGTSSNIYSNTFNNLRSAGSTYGIYYYYPGGLTSGGNFNVYRNKISDISTSGTGSVIYGMYVLGYYANQTVNIYNNLIGNFTASASINSQALTGIYMLPQAAYNLNVMFNSIYLSGTSSGSGFGSNGIYSSSSYPITFANNLVVNNCTPTGAGLAVAHRRSSSTLSTYNINSNNNLYYAGVPSATNLIYTDGTNNLQTIGSYITFMSGREAAAVSENPPIAVLTGSASNYLSISGSSTTQVESGALPVLGITTDYAGTTRSTSAPDIGAWEGSYLNPNTTCSGTPNGGTITVSPSSGCANVPFAVTVSGQTGLNVPGISYSWQTSSSASGPWTNMSGIVGPSFQQTAGVSSDTYYRLVVTCSASALSATSAVVGFTANTCIATATLTDSYGDGWNGGLMSLVVNGQTTTIGSGFTTGSSQVVNFCLPGSTTYSLYLAAPGSYATEMGIILNVAGNTFSIVGANSGGPLSSATAGSLLTTGNTCTSVASCSNVVSGSVTAPAVSGCANQPITLTGSGITSGNGIVYQWQTATSSSGPWTAVSGATNTAYTPTPSTLTYYRLVTTCTVSSLSATTAAFGYTVNSCAATLTLTDSYGDGWNGGQMILVVNGQTTTLGSGFTTGTSQVLTICLPTASTYSLIFSAVGSYPTEMGVIMSMGGSTVFNLTGANSGGPLSSAPAGSVLATGLTCQCSSANGGTVSTASYSICGNATLNLAPTGFSGGTGITYTWQASPTSGGSYTNFVGGSGNNTSSFTTPTLSPGTYYFRMTASCNGTLNGTSNEVTVSVVSPATPSVASTSSVICGTDSATLTATGANSYTWSTGATTNSIVITPTNAGYYYVTGAGNSPCPNVVTPYTSIYYSQTPTVSASSNTGQVCSGAPAGLSAIGATTYSWSNSSSGASITINPTTSTVYTVNGYYPGGCFGSATVSITVNPNPALNTSGSTGICTGQNASVTASGATSYSWSTGATTNSIVTSPPTGVTVYTVTGTDALGCTSTISHTVNVAASLSISIVGPSSICIGQTANLAGNGGVTYTWNTGATTSTIAPSPTITTTYSIIGASGTCSNTGITTVSVNPNPTVSITGGAVICVGQTATLTANGASTYTWNTSSNSTSIAVSPSVNTTYTLIGRSVPGCTASATQAVTSNTNPIINVAQSSNSICVNSPATFTATGANTYTWSTSANTTTISITPTASAVYSISGTNAAGCSSSGTFALGAYPLPVISIAPASSTVCSLSPATFTASGAVTYTWNATSTGASYSANPASSTVYTVVGTNANNCVNSMTVGVTTNTLPVITIAPASATVCAFGSANFTASGAATYTWNNTTSGSTVTLFQPASTTHTVSGTNSFGCKSSSTVGVVTTPLPTLTLTPSFTTICAFSTTTLSASGANTYSWSSGSTTNEASVSPSVTSAYTVTGTDALGCSSSSVIVVVTNTLPLLSIVPASATICALSTVSMTASGASSYTWSNGPATASISVTPSANTVYTVSGTDANNGCVANKTVAVNTNPLPIITITPSGSTVCPGTTANLSASGANTYTWLVIGANTSTIAVTPTANTVYSVSGTDNLGCSSSKTVDVNVYPTPNIVAAPASQTICLNETATVTASGGTSYTWMPISGSNNVFTVSPTILAQYTVTGTDANNCNGSAVFLVHVSQCNGIANNGGIGNLVSVFPNPSEGHITTKFEFDGRKEVVIVNAIGQVVETRVTENSSEVFNLSQMAKGVYYVKVNSKVVSGNFRIIVQ